MSVFGTLANIVDERGVAAAVDEFAVMCPLCLGQLVSPYYLRECGHNFCKSCLMEMIARKRIVDNYTFFDCPVCRTPATRRDAMLNRPLTSIVNLDREAVAEHEDAPEELRNTLAVRELEAPGAPRKVRPEKMY